MTKQKLEGMIKEYLASKQGAWTAATLQSEASRLNALVDTIDGSPERLWKALEARGQAPYTRLTTFTRVNSFWRHATGSDVYGQYKARMALKFKHVYQPKFPTMTIEQARAAIDTLESADVKAKALQLLEGGLRFTESLTLTDKHVTGKGNKIRRVYVKPVSAVAYHTLYRALATIGLTPHMLRKLAATSLASGGLSEHNLCQVMGWNSITTAKVYLTPMNETRMAEEVARVLQGKETPNNETKQVFRKIS